MTSNQLVTYRPAMGHLADEVFRAIADPSRRRILAILEKEELPLKQIEARKRLTANPFAQIERLTAVIRCNIHRRLNLSCGDVRVLCNIEPSERWMETMLHEFGHATYDREYDRTLPWLLRTAGHALTTEGVAMSDRRLPRACARCGGGRRRLEAAHVVGRSEPETRPLAARESDRCPSP